MQHNMMHDMVGAYTHKQHMCFMMHKIRNRGGDKLH